MINVGIAEQNMVGVAAGLAKAGFKPVVYGLAAFVPIRVLEQIKIDRSFITALTGDPRSAAIVRSTIELAHALQLRAVAEGVEDERTLAALAAFGCDSVQGYYLCRPLPAIQFASWARAHTRNPSAPELAA